MREYWAAFDKDRVLGVGATPWEAIRACGDKPHADEDKFGVALMPARLYRRVKRHGYGSITAAERKEFFSWED